MKKIIVFLPAHNEENSIEDVINRIPRDFHADYKVEILVIDDGSTDRTVQIAKRAGADHIRSFQQNKGLGAAVREGLHVSAELDAEISVMIDADNEYPSEQIPELVAPIINGNADYVMGSRFKGTIKGMKIHRRLGNYLFTLIQSILLKRWIYDGQSGMRAFSREATQDAEIIHDYNYAQVVTLNLVRKGYRMKEIPIRYQVRTKGQSFIKFKAYMSSVIPAIYKEMRRKPAHKAYKDELTENQFR
ncbi:glycosyltransferase family 2 protein [Pseudalkalibacillus berkeleyi]|uniref:Glycosyltransferase family 2 protein n=1 Tax=Pseudalkalibacillus berkeleyi TaxID=1069813 RepID=A0ABS9GZH6_9BACL|nr:glycosyltransferase family 2 protein [Pseudalkalibacillus berkeleyi]MCF6138154.1 glycosyltransferase family 2 protein [Pseudalkalibacillus berkeleyi]